MQVRILAPGDEPALEAFLTLHADSSMILRSNVRAAGLVDRKEPYQATYAAAFEGDAIVAVAAHCWNGNLLLQAPAHVEPVYAPRPRNRAVASWDSWAPGSR